MSIKWKKQTVKIYKNEIVSYNGFLGNIMVAAVYKNSDTKGYTGYSRLPHVPANTAIRDKSKTTVKKQLEKITRKWLKAAKLKEDK